MQEFRFDAQHRVSRSPAFGVAQLCFVFCLLGCDKAPDKEVPEGASKESPAAQQKEAGDPFPLPKGFPLSLPPKRDGEPEIQLAPHGVCVSANSKASVAELVELYTAAVKKITPDLEVIDPILGRERTSESSAALIRKKGADGNVVSVSIGGSLGGVVPLELCTPADTIDPAALKELRGKPNEACVKYCERELECTPSKEKVDCAARCVDVSNLRAAMWACADKPCDKLSSCALGAAAAGR